MVPGPSPVRRLSRTQYTATVRDLFNLHVDIGATLRQEVYAVEDGYLYTQFTNDGYVRQASFIDLT
jgi:hypothetical protein